MPSVPAAELWRFDDVRAEPDDASAWSGRWTVPAELPYFAGHFPGMPVLPAAVIMEVALAFLRRAVGAGLNICSARHCKFKAPVTPGEVFLIRATSIGAAAWQVTWTPAGATAPVVELELGTARAPA